MLTVGLVLTLVFLLGIIVGALAYGPPNHCVLSEKECRKSRARLNLWAKRYKRKVEELSHDVRSDS